MVHIRWMLRQDMPQVVKIEQDTFGDWDENTFLELLRCKPIYGLVACIDDVVLGYAVFENSKQDGEPRLTVINLAAMMPVARSVLINDIRRRSKKQNRTLCWDTEPTT